MQSNDARLKQVMADVLGLEPAEVGDATSVDSVPAWDSLRHMNLVLALEAEFSVTLSEEQSVEILSYPLIKAVLQEHHVSFNPEA